MALNLDQFAYITGLGPAPKYWAIAIFVISVLTFLSSGRLAALLSAPLLWWVVPYFLASALWALVAQNQEFAAEGMAMVASTCLYVLSALLIYPSISSKEPLWGVTLWSALIIAVLSVLLEYFFPSFYALSEIGQGTEGRGSGLYLNPNIAGLAILMIFACILLRSSLFYGIFASIIALAGVLATFSRAGMMGWFVLVLLSGSVRGRSRTALLVLAAIALGVIAAGPTLFNVLSSLISEENQDALNRLAWMFGQGDLSDGAASEREGVAQFALMEFIASPIYGYGLGYTFFWDFGAGTHNMILRHAVEYGVLGALIFPLFLCSSIWSANSVKDQRKLWRIASVVLLMSIFSHNMLEQGMFLFPWLAACLVGYSKMLPQMRVGQNRRADRHLHLKG